MKQIRQRRATGPIGIWDSSVPEIIQRIYANRGVLSAAESDLLPERLLPSDTLKGIDGAVQRLLQALERNEAIVISGDYDCDGATATAIAVRGLKILGAKRISYIIPDRFKHGYGLTPGLIDDIRGPVDLIVTVDSGIASHAGVTHARSKGIDVVITDHHLPGDSAPVEAIAIVNPNQHGDVFQSKALAGVGVMFYVLQALRKALLAKGEMYPPVTSLLDIVALGTVADLVPLDRNNRILVLLGLRLIRKGQMHAGVKALIFAAGKDSTKLVAQDFGFAIAPKINAAGRLQDMRIGVETLLTNSDTEAKALVEQLVEINKARQSLQETMVAQAEALVEAAKVENTADAVGVVVYEPYWHPGVVGPVASKLKEPLHRPVFAFAPGEDNEADLRGSGRSIEGFHLRDALALMDARRPGLITRYGGHAMAAGLSLPKDNLSEFAKLFDEIAREQLSVEQLEPVVYSDGEIGVGEINLKVAELIQQAGPWGQAFPQPCFDNQFEVLSWWRMSGNHVKLLLRDTRDQTEYEAVYFNGYSEVAYPPVVRVAYELNINTFHNSQTLQLLVKTIAD